MESLSCSNTPISERVSLKGLSTTGAFYSVFKKFNTSVDRLEQTIMFPASLQDVSLSDVSLSDTCMIESVQQYFSTNNNAETELNSLELFMILKNAHSTLLTGNDADGQEPDKDTMFFQNMREMMQNLKKMTAVAECIMKEYENRILQKG